MALSKVANRYAQSFLDTSIEKNILTKVAEDFELVYNSISKSDELLRAIKSPIIKAETKKLFLAEIFGMSIGKDSMSFLDFTIVKGREDILLEILERFESIKDEYTGFVKIDVTTAFDFTSEQKIQLQQKFESYLKKRARLTFKVDGNIIGGFIAKVGDTVYNASMAHQLGLLKKTFLQSSVTLN
ncbi:MAG: ATP synthase F1 subunit delta [Ignavibacteriales bacterium]|nr:ATP synthase F1 subunit delta [Ignavibacteriales bacterium]